MGNRGYEIEKDWIDLENRSIYYLQGIFRNMRFWKFSWRGKKLRTEIVSIEDAGIFARMEDLDGEEKCRSELLLSCRNLPATAAD